MDYVLESLDFGKCDIVMFNINIRKHMVIIYKNCLNVFECMSSNCIDIKCQFNLSKVG